MHKIERLSGADFKTYRDLFTRIGIASDSEISIGYKIDIDGTEYLFFDLKPLFVVYRKVDGKYESTIIQTDELLNVVSFTDNGNQIIVKDGGIDVIDKNHNQQSLYLRKLNNLDSSFANNGFVTFLQYSPVTDVSLNIRYEYNVLGSNTSIFQYRLRDPYFITFQQGASKRFNFLKKRESYYKIDFDITKNRFKYNIGTMREHGIGAVISNGALTIQGNIEFSRFYKVFLQVGKATITGYPFSKPYMEEYMEQMIKDAGFLPIVPSELIAYYHNREDLYQAKQSLIDIYKNSEFYIKDGKKKK